MVKNLANIKTPWVPLDFPSTASKPTYSGYADGHQSWRDEPAELMQLAAAIRHWNWHLILYILYNIYICVYYIYDKYHSISFHIIHISRMWPCVILCLVVLIGYYGLPWLHMASFSLFSSPAFARASIAAMTAGGAPVRLPKGLRWLLQWLSTHFGMFDLSCWMNIKTNPITTPISSNLQLPCWLVVWNMAFIFHILGIN